MGHTLLARGTPQEPNMRVHVYMKQNAPYHTWAPSANTFGIRETSEQKAWQMIWMPHGGQRLLLGWTNPARFKTPAHGVRVGKEVEAKTLVWV